MFAAVAARGEIPSSWRAAESFVVLWVREGMIGFSPAGVYPADTLSEEID